MHTQCTTMQTKLKLILKKKCIGIQPCIQETNEIETLVYLLLTCPNFQKPQTEST
jgi:hypothetical protein